MTINDLNQFQAALKEIDRRDGLKWNYTALCSEIRELITALEYAKTRIHPLDEWHEVYAHLFDREASKQLKEDK